MNLTRTAFGSWSGGRFMHFGEALDDARYINLVHRSYEKGTRSFITADVYGGGRADTLLGEALKGIDRSTYNLTGIVGHDFYGGLRAGAKGYPRFTEPGLRSPEEYASYLVMATEKSLERCGAEKFDLLMLHNPDSVGYSSEAVWDGMRALKQRGLVERLGIAPGPANGFTLDIIGCFEKFAADLDWAMIILNPFEPWPGQHVLAAAKKHNIDLLARVVDFGGIFHDDVKPGHKFRDGDHRTFRPQGWVEHGCEKLEKVRPIAEKYGLTMLQFSAIWDLSQEPVKSVVPTLIQEAYEGAKSIESKVDELAALPDVTFTPAEVAEIAAIGDNTGCMKLKGASERHAGQDPRADEWPIQEGQLRVAERWGLGATWAW
ncbi:aryl-alcohol dehydrogenase-like predicted oxidoreductase [Roseimicrobium gellanilyticum]|uniref:Aryl-alcohol dehydrogenase-like predicted oxidoreductase n=1 Tax=Roseimicrobium gellanilyticum TaxID=748857 RepID=A0A366H969_9BACT|nr:aldo/keto reductase [Roseimicrobium gellanilyticum]RBP38663.1 aryl-alcohol dehydrogenase-like predicted oxidoreductase [Roseimicrobium gellanilyticum]